MNNPFQISQLGQFQNVVRTALWLAIAINAGIVLVSSVLFTYHFVSFGWRWVVRTMFSAEWGME